MAHGYLGDGYGTHGELDRDRDERDWRERSWRGEDWRDRDRHGDHSVTSGWSDRDEWRGGRQGWSDADLGRRDTVADRGDFSGPRNVSPHGDDHYRSWRDRHMSELDRDYEDYCREREEQFHREFGEWRRQKYGNPQPLQPGMTQSGISHDPSGATQAIEEGSGATAIESDPTATATLGTNSGGGGRSRR